MNLKEKKIKDITFYNWLEEGYYGQDKGCFVLVSGVLLIMASWKFWFLHKIQSES